MSISPFRPASGPPTKLPDDWVNVTPETEGYCYLIFYDDDSQWQILAHTIGPYPNFRTITEMAPITSKKPFVRRLDRNGYYHIYSDGVGVAWHKLGFKPSDVLGARAVGDDYWTGLSIMAAAVMVSMLFGCMAKGPFVFAVIGLWTFKLNQYTDSCDDHNDLSIQEMQTLQKNPRAEIFRPVSESKPGWFAMVVSFWFAWARLTVSQVKMMALVMASTRHGGGCIILMAIVNMGHVMASPAVDAIETICLTHAGGLADICHTSLSQLHNIIGSEFDTSGSSNAMCLESPELRRYVIEHELWSTEDETEDPVFDVLRKEFVKAFCPNAPTTDPMWWPAAKHQTYIALKKKRDKTGDGFKTKGSSDEGESKIKNPTTGKFVDEFIGLSTGGLADAATNVLTASHTIVRTAVSAQGHVQSTANSLIGTGVEAMRATADEVTRKAATHTNVMAGVVDKTVNFADAVGTLGTDALFASANSAVGIADAVKTAAKATIDAATDHMNEHAEVPAAILGKTVAFADAVGSLGGDTLSVGTSGAIDIAAAIHGAAKATIGAATGQIKGHAGIPAVILDGTFDMVDEMAAALPSGRSVGMHVGAVSQQTVDATAGVAIAIMNDGVSVVSTVATEAIEWRSAMFNMYSAIKRDIKEGVPAAYASTKAGVGHAHNFMKSEFYQPTTLANDMTAVNEVIRTVSADVGKGALDMGANMAKWVNSKSAMDWQETILAAAEALPETVEIVTKAIIRPVDVVAEHMSIEKTTFTDVVKNFREAVLGEDPVKAATTGIRDLRTGFFGETTVVNTWYWLTTTAFSAAPFSGATTNPSVGVIFTVGFSIVGLVFTGFAILKVLGITNAHAYDPMPG